MVARQKLKEQIAAGDETSEKKLKVQKKNQDSKGSIEARDEAPQTHKPVNEEQKKDKRSKKQEKRRRKENNADGEEGENAATKRRKTGEQEGDLEKAGGEERIEAKVDAEERVEIKADKKKNKKNKKKVDRWGAPVVEEPPNAAEENTAAADNHQSEEAAVEYEPKKVYVGGMPYNTTEDDIYNYFAECGAIDEIDCTTFPDTGKFRGLAFITFKTELAAKKALELDGADMNGRFLRIQKCLIKEVKPKPVVHSEPAPKSEGCTSVYIGNLSWDVTEKDIRDFFKKCKIQEIRLVRDRETGEFKGFGHVDFDDDESVEKAIKLDQKLLLERPMKISYAVPRKKKPSSSSSETPRKKKSGCYNCGEDGHMSFKCPKKAKI